MLRLAPVALALTVIAAAELSAQATSPDVSGTYVTEARDAAYAGAPFVGLTYRLTTDTFSLSGPDGELVAGRYSVRTDTLSVWDESGPLACDTHLIGRYTFERTDEALRLTLVEDECPGRRQALTSVWLMRSR